MIINNTIKYENYLSEIVNEPGKLSSCYSMFHNYSILNQLFAAAQMQARDLPLAPIASYKRWIELGRQVKKGSKALKLLMPVMINKKDKEGNKTDDKVRIFVERPNWFSLDQTEGADYKPEDHIKDWDADLALKNLDINQVPFQNVNGNCQGYATERKIAINPLAALPHKTRFHELAHVVLNHTAEHVMSDSELTAKDIKEVEAESVAYILCQLLNLPGAIESRGYIQSWLGNGKISEKSAAKIFGAADKILKAGQAIAV